MTASSKKTHCNGNMHTAKRNKNDEFYTRYPTIADELEHYTGHFADKVIYCNCDDPAKSNFVKYFRANRKRLGIRGLLTNHIKPDGAGDFRGKDALAKLAQADIVVSNPPFSLFRQYIAQLIAQGGVSLLTNSEPPKDKSFIVLANYNAITINELFPLMVNGRMWCGVNHGSTFFDLPKGDKKDVAVTWLTNLDHGQREPLKLTRKYNRTLYPRYDNYDAINIDAIKDIPCDYDGLMGVPITFMMQHDPRQFDVLAITNGSKEFAITPTKTYRAPLQHRKDGTTDNGGKMNTSATLPALRDKNKVQYSAGNAAGYMDIVYKRVIIRKRAN